MSPSPITAVIDELAGQIPDRASSPGSVTDSEWTGLCDALALVADPRRRRGVRYPFAVILTIVVCAMVSGARSFAAIGEWVADLPTPSIGKKAPQIS